MLIAEIVGLRPVKTRSRCPPCIKTVRPKQPKPTSKPKKPRKFNEPKPLDQS